MPKSHAFRGREPSSPNIYYAMVWPTRSGYIARRYCRRENAQALDICFRSVRWFHPSDDPAGPQFCRTTLVKGRDLDAKWRVGFLSFDARLLQIETKEWVQKLVVLSLKPYTRRKRAGCLDLSG